MTYAAQSGHPGGSLSVTDLVTALVFHELKLDPARVDWPDRDRLVLSKGHASPALYAALSLRGFLPREELASFRKLGSRCKGTSTVRNSPASRPPPAVWDRESGWQ